MQIIQNIREKGTAIVIVVIALSLIGFILMDAKSGGKTSLFGGSSTTNVGEVNGEPIEYKDFTDKVKQTEDQYGGRVSGNQVYEVRQSVWDQLVAEKVIISKEKSTFILSKFSKVLAKRKINELNRELLLSESDYEKGIFKKRIARLSGHMTKIKIGLSNKYEITEQRQKVENAMSTLKSALEEGILPGGASIFLYLREEISNWSTMNLIGDEVLAATIVNRSLAHPFKQLFNNLNLSSTRILSQITQKGYPYTYDVLTQKMVNGFETGLVDSSKSIRAILWNSLTIVSTLITAE